MYTMPAPWKIWFRFLFLRLLRAPRYDLNLTIIGLGLLLFLAVTNLWQMSMSSPRVVTLSAFHAFPSAITCSARFSSVCSGIPCISKLCLRVYCSRSSISLNAVPKSTYDRSRSSLAWLRGFLRDFTSPWSSTRLEDILHVLPSQPLQALLYSDSLFQMSSRVDSLRVDTTWRHFTDPLHNHFKHFYTSLTLSTRLFQMSSRVNS